MRRWSKRWPGGVASCDVRLDDEVREQHVGIRGIPQVNGEADTRLALNPLKNNAREWAPSVTGARRAHECDTNDAVGCDIAVTCGGRDDTNVISYR